MSSPLRMEVTFFLAAIAVTWVCGLRIGFPGIPGNPVPPRSFNLHPKRSSCQGNPCHPSRPFLCLRIQSCVRLIDVCDGKWDCEDGFDEDPAVCAAVTRPPEDALWDFLERQRQWILPQLFHGADPQLVAHELTVGNTVGDLQKSLGLTTENMDNIRKAMEGALEGDERFLLKLGMPARAWPEVKDLLETLYNTGLDVWSK